MVHAKRISICALFVLLLSAFVLLVATSADFNVYALDNPSSYGSGYSAIIYNNKNGLPTSDANAVTQTEEGFLWIGSYSGLIRYDGNEFHRYDATSGVSSVVSLFADDRNRLWIGTNDSGVFLLENETFRSYTDKDGLRSLSVRSMTQDDDGNLLVATTMGVAYVDPDGALHVIDDSRINREYVCELVKDAAGTVYGVTDEGAFFLIKNLAVTAYYAPATFGDEYGTLRTIYPDPKDPDKLYFGTEGAYVLHGKVSNIAAADVLSVAPRRNVRCLKLLDNNLWVCSDDGIGFLYGGVYFPIDDLPMNNSVEKIFLDLEGNLWFTSSRQGLMKIVRNRFDLLGDFTPRVVNTVLKNNGLYYVGTDTGLIVLDEDKANVDNAATALLGTTRIRSVQTDRAGHLWFGTGSKGVVCYDPESDTTVSYSTENGLSHKHARVMTELSDGRIAVATKGGVNVIENGVVTASYGNQEGIHNLEILCVEEGPDGAIYAGSDGDGIYVIHKGHVGRIGRVDGLASEVIMRIKKDPVDPSLYWIVTGNSIAYMKDGKATPVTGFPYANNFDLYFDAFGRVWVLSGNGIYVVKKSVMLQNGRIDYDFYDTSDGLPAPATANSYSFLDTDGTLYIAGSQVGSTNINDDYDYAKDVLLSMPYVLADDLCIPVKDGKVTVPASCKKLTICAYAFTYSLNNPHLTYQLEGFDEEATTLLRREMRPAVYTNLPGGEYKFALSVLNTMTGETDNSLVVTIVKQKNIYEQAWFWVLIGLAVVGSIILVVVLIFRKKTANLLKKQAQDKELINEMTSAFASCIDLKDPYTNGHSHRVAKITAMIAEKMGLDKEVVEKYHQIALLHDIGKIAIPDNILNKPGRLTDEEFAVMKKHSERGYEILKEVKIAPDLALGAGYHHERQDGRGYPNGITKEEIPFVAQIIAVADTFDAMYSNRPYRKTMPLEAVVAELKRVSGTQLNPEVVATLLSLIEEGAFTEENRNETPAKKNLN